VHVIRPSTLGIVAIRIAPAFLLIAAALAFAGTARADADPASDTLYVQSLFLPYSTKVSPAAEAKLRAAIARSRAAGRPIKVALIAGPRDLGGVPQLFGNPVYYARFLDAELQFLYSGRLLVVMPQGAGLAQGGRAIADNSVVAAKPGPGGDGLAETAAQLVDEIATGKPVAPTGDTVTVVVGSSSHSKSSGFPVGLVTAVAIFAVFVLIAVAGVFLARKRRA
jgi:hypothetical protein